MALALIVATPPVSAQAMSDRRVALVIGNASYDTGKLRNPANDAEDMAALLKKLDFVVFKHVDLAHQPMEDTIRAFGQSLRGADVGLFYYAGHAVQVEGRNYLIPIGADVRAEKDFKFKAVDLSFLLDELADAGNPLNVVILDACRDNPYRSFFRTTRSGLALTDAPSGTLIAFATAPGSVAADGTGRNGTFTRHLLATLQEPGLTIEQVLKQTRIAVRKETQNLQTPWENSSLIGDLVLRPGLSPPPPIDVTRRNALGTLEVTVTEGDAEILLNGKSVGRTRGSETLTLSNLLPGRHVLEVTKERFLPFQQAVDIQPEQTARVQVGLQPRPPEPGDLQTDPAIGMRFRYIPPGTFRMGSPPDEPGRYDRETRHEVTLTRGYWLGETEVTQGQWRQLMGNNPSRFTSCGDSCPVENVNWYEAVAFANALSRTAGLAECYQLQGCQGKPGEGLKCTEVVFAGLGCAGYRLPTEAEWERAARAGTETAIYTGALTLRGERNGPELDPIAWYGGNSGVSYEGGYYCSGWREKQTPSESCGPHPVGQKQANAWNLEDMLGNVWEWCGDWHAPYSSAAVTDPQGPAEGPNRVFRGGSWIVHARFVRAAYRFWYDPGYRIDDLGFRLARGQGR